MGCFLFESDDCLVWKMCRYATKWWTALIRDPQNKSSTCWQTDLLNLLMMLSLDAHRVRGTQGIHMRCLMFSRRWRFKSPGLWRYAVAWEDFVASKFRVKFEARHRKPEDHDSYNIHIFLHPFQAVRLGRQCDTSR